jgi:UMF1 family MFS transporter
MTSLQPPTIKRSTLSRAISRHAPARERWSWALYDFSNTIFSMNVTTLYFSVWLVSDLGASNTMYAAATAVGSVLVIVTIPVLGALSDARRRRKSWVVGFTLLSCAATAAIGITGERRLPRVGAEVLAPQSPPPGWHPNTSTLFWVLAAFAIANFAYQAALPFYNAMMPELVPAEEQGRLSGIGTALGYVGSIVGVLLVVPFFNGALPMIGALPSGVMHTLRRIVPFTSSGGRVATFVPTAALFLLFSIPLFVFCHDRDPAPRGTRVDWRSAFREVAHTVRDSRRYPGALRFIIASLLYQDARGTIISFMTLYAVKAIGFTAGTEITLFLVLTIPAIFGSYAFGFLVDRLGAKRSLNLTLVVWVLLLVAMAAAPSKAAFWLIGVMIGLNFGGVPTAERPVLLTLVPDAEAGRYFSLMLLSAQAAGVAGPLIWAVTVDSLEPRIGTGLAYRAAVLSVVAMFIVALIVFQGVPDRFRTAEPRPH